LIREKPFSFYSSLLSCDKKEELLVVAEKSIPCKGGKNVNIGGEKSPPMVFMFLIPLII